MASAIYGSDAIAGVVNIITKQIQGHHPDASYGQPATARQDSKASITGGFGDLSRTRTTSFHAWKRRRSVRFGLSDRPTSMASAVPTRRHGYDLGTGTGYAGYRLSGTSVSSSNYGYARPYTSQNGSPRWPGSAYQQLATPAGLHNAGFVSSYGYTGAPGIRSTICSFNPRKTSELPDRGTLEISPVLSAFAEAGGGSSPRAAPPTRVDRQRTGRSSRWHGETTRPSRWASTIPKSVQCGEWRQWGAGYNARLRYATAIWVAATHLRYNRYPFWAA